MARTLALRASAGLVAGMAMAAITLAPGARAETGEQFPGDGVFLVGTDIAPGTYRTEGPSNPLIWCSAGCPSSQPAHGRHTAHPR